MRGWRSLQGREETPEGCVPLRVLPGRFLRVLVGSTLFGTVPKRGRGLGLTPPTLPVWAGREHQVPGTWAPLPERLGAGRPRQRQRVRGVTSGGPEGCGRPWGLLRPQVDEAFKLKPSGGQREQRLRWHP